MTITEALSEFRKIAREYRAMSKMEEVVEALAEPVLLKQKLDADITKLKGDKEFLVAEVQSLKTQIQEMVSSKEKVLKDLESTKALKKLELDKLIVEARIQAKEIIDAGHAEVAKLKGVIEDLNSKKIELITEVRSYESKVSSIKEKVAEMKKGLKEQFGI